MSNLELNHEQLKRELIVVEVQQPIETKQVEQIDHYNLVEHLFGILRMIVD
jgi:hypothetical protein